MDFTKLTKQPKTKSCHVWQCINHIIGGGAIWYCYRCNKYCSTPSHHYLPVKVDLDKMQITGLCSDDCKDVDG